MYFDGNHLGTTNNLLTNKRKPFMIILPLPENLDLWNLTSTRINKVSDKSKS